MAGGIRSASRRSARPAPVNSTARKRSSWRSRPRVTMPPASSRFNSGDSVPGSSCSWALSALTDKGDRCQSASITRYCGCVRPSGSSTGRYSPTTLRAATTSA